MNLKPQLRYPRFLSSVQEFRGCPHGVHDYSSQPYRRRSNFFWRVGDRPLSNIHYDKQNQSPRTYLNIDRKKKFRKKIIIFRQILSRPSTTISILMILVNVLALLIRYKMEQTTMKSGNHTGSNRVPAETMYAENRFRDNGLQSLTSNMSRHQNFRPRYRHGSMSNVGGNYVALLRTLPH